MAKNTGIFETNYTDIGQVKRGKVRDNYDLGKELLIVTSDRISAFDVVLPTLIPNKGMVLTGMSVFWFDLLKDVVKTHFITADVAKMPPMVRKHAAELEGRSMLVKKAKVFPVECIVRGYMAGSGWKEYRKSGTICGAKLPAGLKESDRLPEPIFTPSTKAESGHDENISFEKACDVIGKESATRLRDLTLAIYKKAAAHAESRGIIICDTKFEFGMLGNEIILVDEVLTPDSSRFWPKELYKPGQSQPSFDKQFVRDYLETLKWDKTPPAPELPADIVKKTSEKYLEALKRLTGSDR
jgi:phosphoribosylaminoimidazole-succinocarboxamide synthase